MGQFRSKIRAFTLIELASHDIDNSNAEKQLAMWSYRLNSIYAHMSCSYILVGVPPGFATEVVVDSRDNSNVFMFSERNSTLLDDPHSALYYVPQDDTDTWPGECNLVQQSGLSGAKSNQGWIKYDRHSGGANYVYYDGHVKWERWSQARMD